MKKQWCSLLLVLTMVLSLLPGTALAAEADTVDVTMSIFNQGIPVKDKANKAVLLRTVRVPDTNGDGKYSLDEALAEIHRDGPTDGYAAGLSDYGYYAVSRLWGIETSAIGFYRNHQMTTSVNEEFLSSGDLITAYIYKDQANWSDRYVYFSQDQMTVCEDTEFEVTLSYCDYSGTISPQATAPLGVFDTGTGTYTVPDTLKGEHLFGNNYATAGTDADGKARISFTEPGTYLLTAQYDSSNYTDYYNDPPQYYLVPPLCQVTVLSTDDYAVYQVLEQAAEALTWSSLSSKEPNAVTAGLTLPGALNAGGETVDISWSCDDLSGALSVYGTFAYVSRPLAQDASSTLKATLHYGGMTTVKAFPVTVKAEGVTEEKESVVSYASLMSGIANTYVRSTDAWTVLDMAAYGSNIKGQDYGYSSSAPIALAEAALGRTPDLSGLSGFDVNGAYAINTTPYVLLAYDAAGVDDTGFTATRDALKASMITYLSALTPSGTDTDTVAPLLSALAPYYKRGDAELDAAVDAAVMWLSRRQNTDGTFNGYYGSANANSTALAVVALAGLGIDAHTDARFVKDKSAVDGLFSFALSTLDGFGYQGNVTKNGLATEQGFRALVAYARYAEKRSAYNIYLDADVNDPAPAAPQISATVQPRNSGDNPDPPSGKLTASIRVADPGGKTYLGKTSFTVNSGSSVYTLLEMTGLNIQTTTTEYGVYIRAIEGLGEFDKGSDSGWMFRVNGVYPQMSADAVILENGDYVEWLYTRDLGGDIGGGTSSAEKAAEQKAAANTDSLIDTIGTVTKNSRAAIEAARKAYNALTDAEKKLVKNYSVLLAAEVAYANLTAPQPFSDVAEGHWAQDAIRCVHALGLMNGTSDTVFSPDTATNRGMIVTILYRLEGAPQMAGDTGFTDVPADAYCAEAVKWAAANGIITGYAGGSFEPNGAITREQLAAVLYRYAAFKGYDVTAMNGLGEFADAESIGSPFRSGLEWANAEGLINGRENSTIDPQGKASRAQVAVILTRFLENV